MADTLVRSLAFLDNNTIHLFLIQLEHWDLKQTKFLKSKVNGRSICSIDFREYDENLSSYNLLSLKSSKQRSQWVCRGR